MFNAEDVAQYILSSRDSEDPISHLKLQKLLYYCQGFHLAIFDKPLFKEAIYHWDHGPVVPQVYNAYKSYGSSNLPVVSVDENTLNEQAKEIINEVLSVYGQFSAWKLRDMTHEESPWANTNDNEEISHSLLKNYFSTQINL